MAVPQVVQFGTKLNSILSLRGDVDGKISDLLKGSGSEVENTLFEILTAAAFQEKGYDPAFVPVNRTEKTPDLVVSVGRIEIFVECKRKAKFGEYESQEALHMLDIFKHVRKHLSQSKLAGTLDLKFFWPSDEIAVATIVGACISAISQERSIYYSWGSCSFNRLPLEMDVTLTRIYSPRFVSDVTGYELDGSQHDGLILQVADPNEFEVDQAISPVGLTWTSLSTKAADKKARAIASLYSKAVSQFPHGSIGVPYVCYTESNGSRLADIRTAKMMEDLLDCEHRASIAVPHTFVNRLYAIPDEHGNPDIIENSVQFRASHLPQHFDLDFPTLIFTNQG